MNDRYVLETENGFYYGVTKESSSGLDVWIIVIDGTRNIILNFGKPESSSRSPIAKSIKTLEGCIGDNIENGFCKGNLIYYALELEVKRYLKGRRPEDILDKIPPTIRKKTFRVTDVYSKMR